MPDQNIKAQDLFNGVSILPQLPKIKLLVSEFGAKTLLDYGSGKGMQYRARNIKMRDGEIIPSVQSYLGVETITCYDPGVAEFQTFPDGQFDGVISTDVLEHCPEPDLPWILDEMFGAARKFIFANIAAYPAGQEIAERRKRALHRAAAGMVERDHRADRARGIRTCSRVLKSARAIRAEHCFVAA